MDVKNLTEAGSILDAQAENHAPELNIDGWFAEVADREAVSLMRNEAVIPLGTSLWPR